MLYYFVYLFTICKYMCHWKKRLDMFIYEKNILLEEAVPKDTVYNSMVRSCYTHVTVIRLQKEL